MGRIKRKSFTLVELIVSIGIVALVLPSIFNIFFIMIRQQVILIAYQEMKKEGDSIASNIKYLLQNRASQITDNTYTIDACNLITSPTPQLSELYLTDRDGKPIHIYQDATSADKIASLAAEPGKKYFLNTTSVLISEMKFSCYKVNDFSPPYVSTSYIVTKSALFKDVSLPYSFSIKLRNY